MNAIGILEQQQANEVLRLEIAYSNLYKAYMLGDRNKMISHYIATGYIGIPNFAESVQSLISKPIWTTTESCRYTCGI